MSIFSIPNVLRLLLCVVLALNGVSGASAAGRMAAGYVEQSVAAVQDNPVATAAQAMPPCHEHDADAVAAQSEVPAAPDKSDQCCDSSTCQCACMHHCAATIVGSLAVLPLQPAADVERAIDVSHRTPALPHLIRPPIS
jgi:hypothetical protein